MSEISTFASITEVFIIALIPNILVGCKKASQNHKRWYKKWDGQYCSWWLAFLVWLLWTLFTHFMLYPLISKLIEDFYTIIGVNNSPIVFVIFLLVLSIVFRKEKW